MTVADYPLVHLTAALPLSQASSLVVWRESAWHRPVPVFVTEWTVRTGPASTVSWLRVSSLN